MGSLHSTEALRLANERLDGLRRESGALGTRGRTGSGRGRIGLAVATALAAIREIDVTPMPRLVEYPYRP